MVDVEGWKKILPIVEFFKNYQVDQNDIELIAKKVYHPMSTSGGYTFTDAINDGNCQCDLQLGK